MKFNVIKISVIGMVTAVVLLGCGSSTPVPPVDADYSSETELSDHQVSDPQIMEDAAETEENLTNDVEEQTMEESYTVDELVEMIKSEETTIDDLKSSIEAGKIYISDERIKEVERTIADYQAQLAKENASGILVAKYTVTSYKNFTYNNNGVMIAPFTLQLDILNPDTGEITHFRTFSSEETHSCSSAFTDLELQTLSPNVNAARRYFNSDYTKMVAKVGTEDGENHIGWIDEAGRFTDVTAKITEKSDFSGLTWHLNPTFFGDYLYFDDASSREHHKTKRVPIENLSPDAVEEMEKGSHIVGSIYPFPDGSIYESSTAWDFYEDSMDYAAPVKYVYDWISPTEVVAEESGTIVKNVLRPFDKESQSNWMDWREETISFIPKVEGRVNWNAVVSPECDRVAFLSRLTNGTDSTPSLFIIPLDGGEPQKVETSYSFVNPSGADYQISHEVLLMDWR